MRFATKIGLSAAVAAIIIGPLLGVAVFYQARAPLQERIVHEQVQIAVQVMRELDYALSTAKGQINVIASDNFLREYLASPLTNEEMADTVANELKERAELTGPWEAMAVFDSNGKTVFSPLEANDITSLAESPKSRIAFEHALHGETYSSDIIVCRHTNQQVAIIAVPVFDRKDAAKVVGVVVAHYAWTTIQKILDHVPRTATVHLFDNKGTVIGKRSDDHLHMSSLLLPAMNQTRTPLPGFDAGYAILTSSTHGGGASLAVDLRQKASSDGQDKGWTLMLEMPLKLMFAPIIVLAKNIGLLVFGVMLAAALLFAVIGHLFLRPLDELVKGVRWVEQGNLDHRVAVKSKDEFGMLADSFNSMVVRLREAQNELVHKGKLAMLGLVASSVGHELRNPLGVMNNAVYFLLTIDDGSNVRVKEYLDIIRDEIDRSELIVAALMDAVRTIPPALATHEVTELLSQVLRRYTLPSGLSINLKIPEKLPAIRVDASQIQQVFEKLINNAVDATADGGIVEISAAEAEEGKAVVISVHDSGIGMTKEQLENLFQPLYTTKARGIGLGLVVVKNLTEANGGRVEVQSEVGKGSVFSVTLPAADEKEGVS